MLNYDVENYVFPNMYVGASVWIGTDNELESWGVYQYSRVKKEETKKAVEEKPPVEEKQEETKVQETIENVPAGDLLEF